MPGPLEGVGVPATTVFNADADRPASMQLCSPGILIMAKEMDLIEGLENKSEQRPLACSPSGFHIIHPAGPANCLGSVCWASL